MSLRMKILEYIRNNENASFFHMVKDLKVASDSVARELTILKDKGCVNVYKGGFYSLTPGGMRELRQLKGEYDKV